MRKGVGEMLGCTATASISFNRSVLRFGLLRGEQAEALLQLEAVLGVLIIGAETS